MNSRNDVFIFEPNCSILEYDMKSCNTSICREFGLLPDKVLDRLEKMPKQQREITFGKLRGKNKELSQEHTKRVDEVVKQFIKQNNLNFEDDIVSIKNDAIFVYNKDILYPTIGNHILFRPKNEYHGYIYLHPFEFYFRYDLNEYNSYVDVKNFTRDVELLKKHSDGIFTLLHEFMQVAEKSNVDGYELNKFCHDIVDYYKKRELDPAIYREFKVTAVNKNAATLFKTGFREGYEIYTDKPPLTEDGYITDSVDISYNYRTIILPLIKLIVG